MENYYSHLWQAAAAMSFLFLNAGDSSAFHFDADKYNSKDDSFTAMFFVSRAYVSAVAACFILNLLLFHISLVRIFVRRPPPLIASLNGRSLRRAAVAMLQLAVSLKGLMMLLVFSTAVA